jgi:peptide-methionine (S)-S-oxide reductase
MLFKSKPTQIPTADDALPGRSESIPVVAPHFVNGASLVAPFPEGHEVIYFGLGCFWGAERLFWEIEGVYVTAVGYQGGSTRNPTYEETCSGQTGHTEAVMVVFDPQKISLSHLLKTFWEEHDPTQGMRQGNDRGTQYRSAIYTTTKAQALEVAQSRDTFAEALKKAGMGPITTEITPAKPFYYAEDYHQQYLAKNPAGYCGLQGTGVTCQITTGVSS